MKLDLLEFGSLILILRGALARNETNREPDSWEVKPRTLGRLALKCTVVHLRFARRFENIYILTAVHELPQLSD